MFLNASSPRAGRTGTRAARDDLTKRETRIGGEEERKRRRGERREERR